MEVSDNGLNVRPLKLWYEFSVTVILMVPVKFEAASTVLFSLGKCQQVTIY